MKCGIGEECRHRLALVLVWVGWLGALACVIFRITEENINDQPWVGVLAVLLIGIAIAASAALGRMRLQDTMSRVFAAGLHAQDKRDEDIAKAVKDTLDRDNAEHK